MSAQSANISTQFPSVDPPGALDQRNEIALRFLLQRVPLAPARIDLDEFITEALQFANVFIGQLGMPQEPPPSANPVVASPAGQL